MVKKTGRPADPGEMLQEYRRVNDLPRTQGNLFSAYRDASPLQMIREEMLSDLRNKLLGFWTSRGQEFPNFAAIPAQAQAALMSWNYGLRLRGAPKMCNAIRAGDFVTAAAECKVPGWDGQKNEGHRVLLLNAAAIVASGAAPNKLPPLNGPFKPPPREPGAALPPTSILGQLAGRWSVVIGQWKGLFIFDAKGGVSWAESDLSPRHGGQWAVKGGRLEWKFNDPGDIRTFTVPLPLIASKVSGTILPAGQGWFTMAKSGGGIA